MPFIEVFIFEIMFNDKNVNFFEELPDPKPSYTLHLEREGVFTLSFRL